jgi:hypothetical protein
MNSLSQTIVNKLQILPHQKQQQFLDSLEDEDLLTNVSPAELQALATLSIAPAEQAKLSDLLARNTESQLSTEELATLDDLRSVEDHRLLDQLDQLNILKARAQYTLQYFNQASAA